MKKKSFQNKTLNNKNLSVGPIYRLYILKTVKSTTHLLEKRRYEKEFNEKIMTSWFSNKKVLILSV